MSALFIFPPVPLDKTGLATDVEQQAQTVILQAIADNTDTIEANQLAESLQLQDIADSVDSIDTKSTAIVTNTADTVAGVGTTNTKIQALVDKTEFALVDEPHDYRSITYVGATTKIATVVYKLGGAAGTTVATLTLGYDGSDRLTSVEKS